MLSTVMGVEPPRPRVLVVDDEPGVRRALQRGLTAEGMDVVAVADGPGALRSAATGAFDVILLDIMLPGLSGYRVLERLRADGIRTPVLLVSAKDGEVDQADGLDLGADGYLVKPFSFVVLVAQVRAILRRSADAGVSGAAGGPLRLGRLAIDRATREVTWSGRAVPLSPREYDLLVALAARADAVVTKDELLRLVWTEEGVTRNAVEVYVGYLRRKLDAAGAGGVVRTVRGHGYLAASSDTEGDTDPLPDATPDGATPDGRTTDSGAPGSGAPNGDDGRPSAGSDRGRWSANGAR